MNRILEFIADFVDAVLNFLSLFNFIKPLLKFFENHKRKHGVNHPSEFPVKIGFFFSLVFVVLYPIVLLWGSSVLFWLWLFIAVIFISYILDDELGW